MTGVERICRLARDLRQPGAPSLSTLVDAVSYRAARAGLDAAQLEAVIASEPGLIDDWLRYSADKRTSGGWALQADGATGWVVRQPFPERGAPVVRRHGTAVAACADYILHELDYRIAVADRRRE